MAVKSEQSCGAGIVPEVRHAYPNVFLKFRERSASTVVKGRGNRDVSEPPLKIENVWHLGKTSTFVDGVDPHTGQLIGRHDVKIGVNKNVCPAIDGAISWNTGSYNPETGLYYKVGQEFCQDMEAQHTDKPKENSGQLYISATWTVHAPPGMCVEAAEAAASCRGLWVRWSPAGRWPNIPPRESSARRSVNSRSLASQSSG